MKTFQYTIKDQNGIHARPAGIIVRELEKFKSTATITKNGTSANLKRLFSLMALNVKCGDTVEIVVTGPDENQAVEKLNELFSENL